MRAQDEWIKNLQWIHTIGQTDTLKLFRFECVRNDDLSIYFHFHLPSYMNLSFSFLFCLFAFTSIFSPSYSVCFRQTPHTDGQWLCLYTIKCRCGGRIGDLKKKCLVFSDQFKILSDIDTHAGTHFLFSRCQYSHFVGIYWHLTNSIKLLFISKSIIFSNDKIIHILQNHA